MFISVRKKATDELYGWGAGEDTFEAGNL